MNYNLKIGYSTERRLLYNVYIITVGIKYRNRLEKPLKTLFNNSLLVYNTYWGFEIQKDNCNKINLLLSLDICYNWKEFSMRLHVGNNCVKYFR